MLLVKEEKGIIELQCDHNVVSHMAMEKGIRVYSDVLVGFFHALKFCNLSVDI